MQKLLENGRSVLKPHEATSDDAALEHWVNLMILGKIDVKQEMNHKKEPRRNLRGTYSIASDTLGEYFTGNVANSKKILVLSDGARIESFNMFARYCNTLIGEDKDYKELIDPMENEDYEDTFILTPDQYMNLLVDKYAFNQKVIEELPEDNPDKMLIRKEMALLRKRKDKFEKEKKEKEDKEQIFNSLNTSENN